jgi:hypothetical protein
MTFQSFPFRKSVLAICLFASSAFVGLGLSAQPVSQTQIIGSENRAITTAVPFLMISPDSRHGALGDAGVALADNSNAIYWNTSALSFSNKKQGYGLSYTPWLRNLVPDVNLAFASGFNKISDRAGTIAYSLTYFSLGEIQMTDINGNPIGTAGPNEFAAQVGYTNLITEKFAVGINIKWINSNLAAGSSAGLNTARAANSVAADANFTYNTDFVIGGGKGAAKTGAGGLPVRFRFGTNVQNLGAKMRYIQTGTQRDFIPSNLKIGYSFKAQIDEFNSIALVNDFNKLLVPSAGGSSQIPLLEGIFGSFSDAQGGMAEEIREINTSIGAEYWYNDLFAIRAGYFNEHLTKGNRKYATVGAGIKYQTLGFDFAYLIPFLNNHPLQNTIRFSLNVNLD